MGEEGGTRKTQEKKKASGTCGIFATKGEKAINQIILTGELNQTKNYHGI